MTKNPETNLKQALKINLAKARLTQRALAELIDISEFTLSRMAKTDDVSTATLRKICKGLDVSMSQFFKDGEE